MIHSFKSKVEPSVALFGFALDVMHSWGSPAPDTESDMEKKRDVVFSVHTNTDKPLCLVGFRATVH